MKRVTTEPKGGFFGRVSVALKKTIRLRLPNVLGTDLFGVFESVAEGCHRLSRQEAFDYSTIQKNEPYQEDIFGVMRCTTLSPLAILKKYCYLQPVRRPIVITVDLCESLRKLSRAEVEDGTCVILLTDLGERRVLMESSYVYTRLNP